MVARGPGAVGCAHCVQIGAEVSCQVCGRLVCTRCEADWATCSEPSGRVIRLGIGARLRDVDPGGQLGLVSTWHRSRKLLDLRRLRWYDAVVPGAWSMYERVDPRLTASGHLICARYRQDVFVGMYALELATREEIRISDVEPAGLALVSARNDRFVYVSSNQIVIVIEVSPRPAPTLRFDPLPRKMLHAVTLEAERGLLAAGSWSEVVLHRIRGTKLELLGRGATHGNVTFVAVAGGWLVAAARADGTTRVTAWALDAADEITDVAWQLEDTRVLKSAALSRDGRDFAFSFGTEVIVRDLATGTAMTFTEHTDEVILIRFAGDDHVLVTADADNRVVLRPRTATGYARALRPMDVPDPSLTLTE